MGNRRRCSSKGRQGQTPILPLTQGVLTPPLGISGQPHCISILLILRPVIASSTKHTPGSCTYMPGLTAPCRFSTIQGDPDCSNPNGPGPGYRMVQLISNLCPVSLFRHTELSQLLHNAQGHRLRLHPELIRRNWDSTSLRGEENRTNIAY